MHFAQRAEGILREVAPAARLVGRFGLHAGRLPFRQNRRAVIRDFHRRHAVRQKLYLEILTLPRRVCRSVHANLAFMAPRGHADVRLFRPPALVINSHSCAAVARVASADGNRILPVFVSQFRVKIAEKIDIQPRFAAHHGRLRRVHEAAGQVVHAAVVVLKPALMRDQMPSVTAHAARAPFSIVENRSEERVQIRQLERIHIPALAREREQLIAQPHPVHHVAGLGNRVHVPRRVDELIVVADAEQHVQLIFFQQRVHRPARFQIFLRARHAIKLQKPVQTGQHLIDLRAPRLARIPVAHRLSG